MSGTAASRLLLHCLGAGEAGGYGADDEAGDAEGDPAKAVAGEGQGSHEAVQGSQGQAGGVNAVIEGRNEGEEGGHAVYGPVAAEEGMGEGEEHQGNGEGVKKHEHRNGGFDDGGEAEESNEEGSDGESGHPHGVGQGRNEAGEVLAAGGDEAYAGGEAGQEYDDPHDDAAVGAEVVPGAAYEDTGTVFLHAQGGDGGSAQEAEEYVNDGEEEAGDEAALQGTVKYFV